MDIEPVPVFLTAIGMILAWIMAGSMGVSFIMKLITTLLTGVVGFFLSTFIANR